VEPAKPLLELVRLRLREGGREAKRPMLPRLTKDSLRGRWVWVEEESGMEAAVVSLVVVVVDEVGLMSRGGVRGCRGDLGEVGGVPPSRKGSAMMRVESKSGNISGPSSLMTSVTSADNRARSSRSLTRVFAEVGLRERTSGRRDLKMSMPVSPKRSAAKVMEGKKTTPKATTIQRGIHSGIRPWTRLR